LAIKAYVGISNYTAQVGKFTADMFKGLANALRRSPPSAARNAAIAARSGIPLTPLTIMPFGDSVAYGTNSSGQSGTGYRCQLGDYLASVGYTYSMVGSVTSGNCDQNASEGHNGATIAQLDSIESCTVTSYMPNVVLLSAGSDDLAGGDSLAGAVTGMKKLITDTLNDGWPNVVLVSGLIPSASGVTGVFAASFNQQISDWISQQQSNGETVMWVDTSNVDPSDLLDGAHPDNLAYTQIAADFADAIFTADDSAMIPPPGSPSPGSCDDSSVTASPGNGGGVTVGGQTLHIAQHVADPSYFLPGGTPDYWPQLTSSGSSLGIAVANVLNGPDYQARPNWASAIGAAHNAGVKVLGYVDTGYLGLTGRQTRLGSTSYEDWRDQAEQDVNAWYNFYGPDLGGIFFDDGYNTCGSGNQYANDYKWLSDYVKKNHPGAITVLNPGAAVPQCYQNSADILLTYEGSYSCYTGGPCPAGQAYTPLSWNPLDPDKIWHIIYGTSASQLPSALAASKANGAGYVYVTDAGLPNPYNTLPSYWPSELTGVLGSGDVYGQPTAPDTLDTVSAGPATATINWGNSANAPVVGYDLYENGHYLKSVPQDTSSSGSTQALIDGLDPGTKYSFTAYGRDAYGNLSPASNTLTVTTSSAASAPAAPTLNVTASDYTSAALHWTATSGAARYDIYNGPAKIMTVPGTVTSATVIGLTPGTSSSFTITVTNAGGGVSRASNAVGVASTALPNGQEISSANVTLNGASGALRFAASFLMPFGFKHVFVVSGNGAPCYVLPVTSNAGQNRCASYMIENQELYKYAGSGTDFTWTDIQSAPPAISGYTYTWPWISPATIGLNSNSIPAVVFEGEGYAPQAWLQSTQT
jgi:hypothetical protein